jgi:hypothetical protein
VFTRYALKTVPAAVAHIMLAHVARRGAVDDELALQASRHRRQRLIHRLEAYTLVDLLFLQTAM